MGELQAVSQRFAKDRSQPQSNQLSSVFDSFLCLSFTSRIKLAEREREREHRGLCSGNFQHLERLRLAESFYNLLRFSFA